MSTQGLRWGARLTPAIALWSALGAVPVLAQGPASAPGASATPQVAAPAAVQSSTPTPDAAVPQAAPVTAAPDAAVPKAVAADKSDKSDKSDKAKKKGKQEYTGPTEVVVLPPTPMMDDDGKQRLDPDGKPMFNPPVAQQRDKKGHPLFDDKGKPVFQTATELGFDEKGHKIKAKKEKPPKMTPVSISRGTFTVDGVIGKAALNYDIADLKYIYLWVPGEGVVVVSNLPFAGASEQKNAFNDTSLKVSVDGHELELASEKRLLGKKPVSAFVQVDRDYKLASKFPVVGYGTLRKPPYAWPGAKQAEALKGPVQPPPVPVDLMPTLAKPKCPAGKIPGPADKKGVTPCILAPKPIPAPATGSTTPAKPPATTPESAPTATPPPNPQAQD